MIEKRLTGRIDRELIGAIGLPPLAPEVLAGYRALADLTSTVSDILDRFGLVGAVPASVLGPSIPGSRIVGRALTVDCTIRDRPVASPAAIVERAAAGENGLADIEAHNLAEPGDVLVVKGVQGISAMGRISARIGKRQGELGAIVDGSVRDLESSRALDYPIWSRGGSPLTGKYRLETLAINRPVLIGGVNVQPGDLVLADAAGVVFVPRDLVAEVLARAQAAVAREAEKLAAIDAGVPIPDLPGVRRDG
ncbi:MAG: hypothetical protein IT352_14555 [Gemmatimonadales bacterium]|nr:hypothetical protein [Gemmatimonadales bacterium]